MSESEMQSIQIPQQMKWQFKRLEKILKETVTMTPNKRDGIKPGQRIIVDLPYNMKCDLSSFTWYYDGKTNHAGHKAADGSAVLGPTGNYVRTRFFPRNSSSVIQNFQVKVNNGIKVDINEYNFIYNMLHDYTQGADALLRRQVGGENSDPSNKLYILENGDIQERRGYSMGNLNIEDVARDKQTYCVRSWLSFLGGTCSTNIVDTAILGTVSIELTMAPASMLMVGPGITAGSVTAANNTPSKNDIGRAVIGATIAAYADDAAFTAANTNGKLNAENADYELNNLRFYCTVYHMHPDFDRMEANVLASGKSYKLWYPNFTVHTGRPVPANNKATTERFTISTECLDYCIGTFRLPNYDTPNLPLNTVFSSNSGLVEGETKATALSQINAGCRRVYNQSRYFAHNGDSIKTTKWKVGNHHFEEQTLEEQYNSLLQHFNVHQDTISGMHPCINSLGAFREHSYASIVSLNIPEKSDIYTLSGWNTDQQPAQIEWTVTSSAYTDPATGLQVLTNTDNCLPYLICAYTSHLDIKAGRVVNYIP